jgi:co-chaperonin GroES (HSP10)
MQRKMLRSINSNYALVEKIEEAKEEGFKTVEVQDCFVYKGKVKQVPMMMTYVDNHLLSVGDVVIFAKYSPDTHEIEKDKFVKITDILAVV